MGLLGMEAFPCAPFLVCREQLQRLWPWVPKGRFQQLLIRNRTQRQGEKEKKQHWSLGQGPGSTSREFQFTQSRPTLCDTMDYSMPGFAVHDQLWEPAQTQVHRWCHPTTSSFVVPLSTWFQSCPASGSFPVSQFSALGGQSIGVLASASVLPMNIQDWFPLGLTGWISLQPKGLSKSLLQHHSSKASILWHSAFFIVQLSHPYMTTGKTILWLDGPLSAK